ncbi:MULTISPECIES: hypothetical protein [unclassified Actinoplanes]|uniref:hypothetical protein n=1 Tax=unclassified Actinoplanes TaxID=2626549 RepID=UPI0002D9A2E6|nr:MULTISPECIES: hypothetical protein [unclassified Actinoplanes]
MSAPLDRHRAERRRLLAGISDQLRRRGIPSSFGQLTPYYDGYGRAPAGLTGLVVDEPDGPGSLQVTVVTAHRVAEASGDPLRRARDVDLEYDLNGEILFEVTTLDVAVGSAAVWSPRLLTGSEEAVVDAVRLWHGYRDTLRATPPLPDPKRPARHARQLAGRRAAAAAPRVRVTGEAAATPDVSDLDHARLCFHFPRDRTGRYSRRAVVALAGYDITLGKRGRWLAARASGDELTVGVEALIDVNQDHRWDQLPWLWRASARDTPATLRWQAPDADHVQPIIDLLRRHEIAEALTLCGVEVDERLSALLAGYPISYSQARYTETWVHTLYDRLAGSAPWRFAAGFRAWQQERRRAGRSDQAEVPLFGLKGLNQQSRPMVALAAPRGVCRLRMIWSAGNARLPRALWELPADLGE